MGRNDSVLGRFEALGAKIKPGAVLDLKALCGLGKVADMTGAKD